MKKKHGFNLTENSANCLTQVVCSNRIVVDNNTVSFSTISPARRLTNTTNNKVTVNMA